MADVRLIDANAMRQEWLENGENEYVYDTNAVLDSIDSQPTINPEDCRPHGRWEPRTDVLGFVRCSVCHDCNIYDDWADGKKWNYCPCCGAKMDGKEQDNA